MAQTAPEAATATQPKSKPRKAKPTRKLAKRAESASRQAIVRTSRAIPLPEDIERVVMEGDLKPLTVGQRLQYVRSFCRALRIDWRGGPFRYIELNGKIVLYAVRNCTDQLRRVWGISVIESRRSQEGELTIFEVKVRDRTGRTDTGTGAWSTGTLKGELLVNAVLKAETKAKRRATLSICGLGMLDESELDTIDDVAEVAASGRVIHVDQPALTRAEHPRAYDVAVYMAQADSSAEDMKAKIDRHLAELRKQTPEQIESLFIRLKAEYEKRVSQPASPAQAKTEGAQPKAGNPQSAPAAESAPSDYDGITLKSLANGLWEISGPESLLRENREAIKKVLQRAALPALCCTAEGCGKLQGALERAKVKFRWQAPETSSQH